MREFYVLFLNLIFLPSCPFKRVPILSSPKALCDSPAPAFSEKELLLYAPLGAADIRWNYEKILFDRAGQPYRRYPPATEINDIIPDIEALLAM